MIKQKQAVVDAVKQALPNFVPFKQVALMYLTKQQLENIKADIFNGIINSQIQYSKDPNNHAEVRAYARSMVMNHLKKARELNGNAAYGNTVAGIAAKKQKENSSINMDILPEDLKTYLNKLS